MGADGPGTVQPAGPPEGQPAAPAQPAAQGPVALRLGWRSSVWIAGGTFAALVLVGLVDNIPDSLLRVGIGVLLAFALDPIVVRVRTRLSCSRAAAVAVVGGVLAAAVAALVVWVGPPAVAQAQDFGRELPQTVEGLYDLPLVGSYLEDNDASGRVVEWVDSLPARIDDRTIAAAAERLLGGVVTLLTVLVVAIAVLVDGDRLVARMLAVIPDDVEERWVRVGRILYRTVGAYFSGSLLVALCAGVFLLVAGLVIGVPLAPVAGLWALVVNMVPQIGGFLTGAFFSILGFSVSPTTGVVCAITYFVWMEFENYVLGPAIVGEAVDLSPATTLVAVLVGGAAAGVVGAMASTPLCGAAKAIYREVRYGDDKPPQRDRPGIADAVRALLRRLRDRRAPSGPAAPGRTPAG